jgi:hypothetical protein
MKMMVTDRRPCKMRGGDLRRVPQNPALGLVGYYVGCPRCGFVTPVLRGDGMTIAETNGAVSFSTPATCVMCLARLALRESECEVEEGADVRPVRRH